MRYDNIIKASFIDRPNRFICHCNIDGISETVHVKNTGRCKELLVEGATVYLERSDNPNRKTQYDLISVEKENMLINMDSQAPNKAAMEWLEAGGYISNPTLIRPETKYGNSRFDFYMESDSEKAFVEVKGVTLEKGGVAMFPDAPTQRGTKHINELISAKREGFRTAVLFVIQMKGCNLFTPNIETDRAFADALKSAKEKGVEILAMDCLITPESMTVDRPIEIKL